MRHRSCCRCGRAVRWCSSCLSNSEHHWTQCIHVCGVHVSDTGGVGSTASWRRGSRVRRRLSRALLVESSHGDESGGGLRGRDCSGWGWWWVCGREFCRGKHRRVRHARTSSLRPTYGVLEAKVASDVITSSSNGGAIDKHFWGRIENDWKRAVHLIKSFFGYSP